MSPRKRRAGLARYTPAVALSTQEHEFKTRAVEDGHRLAERFREARPLIPSSHDDHTQWYETSERCLRSLVDTAMEAIRSYPEYRRYWLATQLLSGFIASLIAQDCEGSRPQSTVQLTGS
jgi:hypothetical protein